VVTRGESARATLRATDADLANNAAVNAIQSDLPVLTAEIAARREDTTRLLAASPSLETIRAEETNWRTLAETLADWKRDLTARAAALDATSAALTQQAGTWRQTLDAARAARVPAEVLQQIEATAKAIEATRDRAETRRSEALVLQSQAGTQSDQVADALDALGKQREQLLTQLFVRDSPPLWSSSPSASADTTAALPWTNQMDALRAYALRDRDRFLVQLALLALVTGGLYWARSRFASWAEAEVTLRAAAPVFASPLATGVVVSILLSLWLHPQAPRLFWSISAALVILPAALLLRKLTDRYYFPLLYALVVFFFVDQLRTVMLTAPVWSRALFLGEMLAAALFLLTFVAARRPAEARPQRALPPAGGTGGPHLPAHPPVAAAGQTATARRGRPRRPRGPFRRRLVLLACRAALVLFLLAFAANALGYARLGALLGGGTLRSAYVALIFSAGLAVADGLLIILLHVRPLAHAAAVRRHLPLLRARAHRLLGFAATLYWAYLTLQIFLVAPAVVGAIRRVVEVPLKVGTFSISLGQILTGVLVVWAAFALSRFIRFLLDEDVYPNVHLPRGLGNALSTIIHYAILVVGFGIAAASLGFPMTQFTILTGAFGVGLGFGLQTIINNFFSGIIVLAERPIRVGDVIEMDAIVGTVTRIGIRATVMRTTAGSEIILPNSRLIAERVINWTLSDRCRGFEIPITADPAAPPGRVLELLEATARGQQDVADAPPPTAQFLGFGPGGNLMFQLRLWTNKVEDWMAVRSAVGLALHAALAAEKIGLK
jgi:small-conductance mechanosensitive channel